MSWQGPQPGPQSYQPPLSLGSPRSTSGKPPPHKPWTLTCHREKGTSCGHSGPPSAAPPSPSFRPGRAACWALGPVSRRSVLSLMVPLLGTVCRSRLLPVFPDHAPGSHLKDPPSAQVIPFGCLPLWPLSPHLMLSSASVPTTPGRLYPPKLPVMSAL